MPRFYVAAPTRELSPRDRRDAAGRSPPPAPRTAPRSREPQSPTNAPPATPSRAALGSPARRAPCSARFFGPSTPDCSSAPGTAQDARARTPRPRTPPPAPDGTPRPASPEDPPREADTAAPARAAPAEASILRSYRSRERGASSPIAAPASGHPPRAATVSFAGASAVTGSITG